MSGDEKWLAENFASAVQRWDEARRSLSASFGEMTSLAKSLEGLLVTIEAGSPDDWLKTSWGPYDSFDFRASRDGQASRTVYIQGVMDHYGKTLVKVERFPYGHRFSFGIHAEKIKSVSLADETQAASP